MIRIAEESRMEMDENIYANTEVIKDNRSDSEDCENSYENMRDKLETHRTINKKPESSGTNIAGSRCSRLAAMCLGLLCVLLLAAVIVLWVKFTAERNQLQTSNNNLTIERNQLQTSNNNLTIERDQLQTSYNNLTIEREKLQASYNNLIIERNQLQTSLRVQTEKLQKDEKKLAAIGALDRDTRVSPGSIWENVVKNMGTVVLGSLTWICSARLWKSVTCIEGALRDNEEQTTRVKSIWFILAGSAACGKSCDTYT